jgi:hypothetical protein
VTDATFSVTLYTEDAVYGPFSLEHTVTEKLVKASKTDDTYDITLGEELKTIWAVKLTSFSRFALFDNYFLEYIAVEYKADGDNTQRSTVFPAYSYVAANSDRYFFSYTAATNDQHVPESIRQLRKLDLQFWQRLYALRPSTQKQNQEKKLPVALSSNQSDLPKDEQVTLSCPCLSVLQLSPCKS